MIYSTVITTGTINVPTRAFVASTDGNYGSAGQTRAVTTIALCNIGEVDLTDESVDSANVNIYLVPDGNTASLRNIIVSNLTVPAGETVFFSDERIILDESDSIWIGSSAGATDTVGSLDSGRLYIIASTGGSDFTTCGAADSNPGTVFTATNDGTVAGGTGTARRLLIVATTSSLPV
jgi:hypothetical protein